MTSNDIINGLEHCAVQAVDRDCDSCPVLFGEGCALNLKRAALELLKAREPRVITWQEVIGAALECKPVYIEVKNNEDKEPGDDRWAMVTQYKDSMTNGMIRAMSSYITSEILFAEEYGAKWRCWTSRPTDEQMEAVPCGRLN